MKLVSRSGYDEPIIGTHFVIVHQSLHFTNLCPTPLAPFLPMLSHLLIAYFRELTQILQRHFRVDTIDVVLVLATSSSLLTLPDLLASIIDV